MKMITRQRVANIHPVSYAKRLRWQWICHLMGCVILTILPLGVAGQSLGNPPASDPGLHLMNLKPADGAEIHYAIDIPNSYSPSTPVPLVVALHYGIGRRDSTGVGGDLLKGFFGPALAELGAIIIAPDSVRGDWNTPENEKALNTLLEMVFTHYLIDKKKVAVTGFSMGGKGSWQIAEKFPDLFSAIIPIAGTPPASASGWRIPVWAIHSREDTVVRFEPTEARIMELQKAGVNANLVPLTGVKHYELHLFGDALRQAVPWLREVWK